MVLPLRSRPIDRHEAQRLLHAVVGDRVVSAVEVETRSEEHYLPTDREALLETVQADQVPAEWQPVDTGRGEEATFLAPLDIVSARGREAVRLRVRLGGVQAGHQPKVGLLHASGALGDRLVARVDPKVERASGTLIVNGLWLEDPAFARDDAFLDALAAALVRLSGLTGSTRHDLRAVKPASLGGLLRKKMHENQ